MYAIHTLSEAVTTRRSGYASHLLALGVHAGLLATAAWLTARTIPLDGSGRALPVGIIWIAPAPRNPTLPRVPLSAPPTAIVPGPLALPAVPAAWPDLPPVPGQPPAAPSPWTWPLPLTSSVPGPAVDPVAPVAVAVVEEPPVLLRHPVPRYPELLRQAGVEGRVTVEAVIDTLGRPEVGSLRVASSTHPLFERAATEVVLGSFYSPGRMSGRAVRVRILVPVAFALRRR